MRIHNDNLGLNFLTFEIGKVPSNLLSQYYDSYKLWKDIFTETFSNIFSTDYKLYSDEFLLHKKVSTLFITNNPIGIICVSQVNLSSPIEIERSYFKNYPPNFLELLKNKYKNVFIISNLAIDPEHRKSISGKCYSTYLIGLSILNFLFSECCALITFTRNDRKTNDIVKSFGGRTLDKQIAYGIESDIMCIEPNDAISALSHLNPILKKSIINLWNKSQPSKNETKNIHWV